MPSPGHLSSSSSASSSPASSESSQFDYHLYSSRVVCSPTPAISLWNNLGFSGCFIRRESGDSVASAWRCRLSATRLEARARRPPLRNGCSNRREASCAREARELSQSVRLAGGQTDRERGSGLEGQSFLLRSSLPPSLPPMGERAERGKAFIQPGFGLVVRPPSAWLSVGRPTVRVCPFGVNHILSSRDRPLSTGLMVIVLFYCFCGKLPGSGTPCT